MKFCVLSKIQKNTPVPKQSSFCVSCMSCMLLGANGFVSKWCSQVVSFLSVLPLHPIVHYLQYLATHKFLVLFLKNQLEIQLMHFMTCLVSINLTCTCLEISTALCYLAHGPAASITVIVVITDIGREQTATTKRGKKETSE